MNYFFYALAALCLCCTSYSSADPYFSEDYSNCGQDVCGAPCCPDWSIEFRVAAFIPTNKRVRNVYSDVWADYQLQIGKRFCNDWQVFAEFSGFEKEGHRSFCSKPKLRIFPITLGGKYFFNLCSNLDAYVGGGVVYSFLRIKDGSSFIHHHISKDRVGGVIKTGLTYTFCNCWFVDVFADYLFQHFSYHNVSCNPFISRRTSDFSGFKVGGGIGYNF